MESADARICREGGARVVTNAMLRDFDTAALDPRDQRRLEILADGLPLCGAHLAVDTTLVSHCTATVLHAPMLPTLMTLSWQRRAAARRERVQNSSVPAEERGWWFWLGRWGQMV